MAQHKRCGTEAHETPERAIPNKWRQSSWSFRRLRRVFHRFPCKLQSQDMIARRLELMKIEYDLANNSPNSALTRSPGSQSCPNRTTTTRSSSNTMAWSTCQPLRKCVNMYDMIRSASDLEDSTKGNEWEDRCKSLLDVSRRDRFKQKAGKLNY